MSRVSLVAAIAAISVGLLASASAQAITFADYSATDSNANLSWVKTGATSGTLSNTGAPTPVFFSFLNPGFTSLQNLSAVFTLNAGSSGAATLSGAGNLNQADINGTFSYIYSGLSPLVLGTHTYLTGANLLSGSFVGANIVGPDGGSTASAQVSTLAGGTISFTSDFEHFVGGPRGISLSMTSVSPTLSATPGEALNSFDSVSTGSFRGGVPEPTTWAMMLLGVAGIGAAFRGSKRRLALATGAL